MTGSIRHLPLSLILLALLTPPGAADGQAVRESRGLVVSIRAGVAFDNAGRGGIELERPGWLAALRLETALHPDWIGLAEAWGVRFDELGRTGSDDHHYVYGSRGIGALLGGQRRISAGSVSVAVGAGAGFTTKWDRVERTVGAPVLEAPSEEAVPRALGALLVDARVPLSERLRMTVGLRDDVIGFQFHQPAVTLGVEWR